MNRFKLVCIGIVVILATCMMCSFTKEPDFIPNPKFCVEYLGTNQGIRVYKITVDNKSYYVAGSNYLKGMCTLN